MLGRNCGFWLFTLHHWCGPQLMLLRLTLCQTPHSISSYKIVQSLDMSQIASFFSSCCQVTGLSIVKGILNVKPLSYRKFLTFLQQTEWLPKDICAHIPRTCEHVISYRERDFEDVIKVRDLKIEKLFWIRLLRLIQPHEPFKAKLFPNEVETEFLLLFFSMLPFENI